MLVFDWLINPANSERRADGSRTVDIDNLKDYQPFFVAKIKTHEIGCSAEMMSTLISDFVGLGVISEPDTKNAGCKGKRTSAILAARFFPSQFCTAKQMKTNFDYVLQQWIDGEPCRLVQAERQRTLELGKQSPDLVVQHNCWRAVGSKPEFFTKGQVIKDPIQKANVLEYKVPAISVLDLLTAECTDCEKKFNIDLEAQDAREIPVLVARAAVSVSLPPNHTILLRRHAGEIIDSREHWQYLLEVDPVNLRKAKAEEFADCPHCKTAFKVDHVPAGTLESERARLAALPPQIEEKVAEPQPEVKAEPEAPPVETAVPALKAEATPAEIEPKRIVSFDRKLENNFAEHV